MNQETPPRPLIIETPEKPGELPKVVSYMLDNPGIYIGHDPAAPEDGEVVMASLGGKELVALAPGQLLDPSRFIAGHQITGPFRAGHDAVLDAEEKSLAARCFANTELEFELFRRVNEILGCNVEECLNDGFRWGADDVGWDDYDESIEVIRPDTSVEMTLQQANAILNLGFDIVYETIGQRCQRWDRHGVTSAHPSNPDQVQRLRATLEVARTEIARLRTELFSLVASRPIDTNQTPTKTNSPYPSGLNRAGWGGIP